MKTKKLLALMLAGAMTLGCAVPTMANTASSSGTDDISNATGSKTIDVDAVLNKTASDDADPVYAATITWSAGTITGTLKKQTYTWDAANTTYVADTYTPELEDATVNTPVSIKVTNKSNDSIYYSITEKDLSTDYTLTHSASPVSVAKTEITAADLVDSTGSSTGTTARAAMKAGNTDTTLTGKGIDSAEYKDTVTLTGTTKTMATAATDVAEYVVDIQTTGIKLTGADIVAIGGTTTLTASALGDGIGTPGTDGTLTWKSSNESVMTVDTNGKVTPASGAKFGDKATITATYTYNGTIYTDSKDLTVDVQYTLTGSKAGSKVLSASALLATADSAVTYDDDADGTANAVAYNGYISVTSGANWADALDFVSELNGATYSGTKASSNTTVITNSYSPKNKAKIVPSGQNSSGQWRLLTVYEYDKSKDADDTADYLNANQNTALDVAAWARASGGTSGSCGLAISDAVTKFGGVSSLWSSQEHPQPTDTYEACAWGCSTGDFGYKSKTSSDIAYGFVVVWDPAE